MRAARWLNRWVVLSLLLFVPSLIIAQTAADSSESAPSLADVARQSREAHKSDADKTKVLTNEDLRGSQGPIPEIALDKTDNSAAIFNAIVTYSEHHTAQETETVVHEWYDQEISLVHAAVSHNVTISQDRASVTSANSIQPRNYEDYRLAVSATQQRDLSDLRTMADNQQVISKVTTTLQKVKVDLKLQKRLEFTWFDADYPQVHLVPMTNRPY